MKFVCFTEWHELPKSADILFDKAAMDSVFLSRAWFECMSINALDSEHSLLLACVLSAEKVMAIVPLVQCIGTKNYYALKHGFTPLYNLLLVDEKKDQVLCCLVQGIEQMSVKGVLLEPVAKNECNINAFQTAMESASYRCEYVFRQYNWICRLQGQSYAQYMAARPSKLRNTILRKKRKLQREHGFDIQLFIGKDALRGMDDYYKVYNASWKQNEISNAGFQDCFVEKFSMAGWSRLAIMYVNKQPVAAQLWFVHNKKASIFRLAYDNAWRQYSPGSILTSYLMEYVIDTDKVEMIDFLTGNDAYKQDWMTEHKQRFLLSCVNLKKPVSQYNRIVQKIRQLFLKSMLKSGDI